MGTKAPQPPPIDPATGKVMRPDATATPPPPPPLKTGFLSSVFAAMIPAPLGTVYPHLVCVYLGGNTITRISTGGSSMVVQESSQVFIDINNNCNNRTVGVT